MELIKINKVVPAVIEWDQDLIEQNMRKWLEDYKDWYETAETARDFSDLRAALNKSLKEANDKRKEIKRELTKPIQDFEKWFKQQTELFEPLLEACKKNIDEHEKRRIDEKMSEIKQLDGIEFFEAFNEIPPEWENKSYNFKKIEKDIEKSNEVTQDNIKTIESSAKLSNLEPDRYIKMLSDMNVGDIIDRMKDDKELLDNSTVKPKENDIIVEATIKVKGKQSVLNAMWKWANNNEIEMERVD